MAPRPPTGTGRVVVAATSDAGPYTPGVVTVDVRRAMAPLVRDGPAGIGHSASRRIHLQGLRSPVSLIAVGQALFGWAGDCREVSKGMIVLNLQLWWVDDGLAPGMEGGATRDHAVPVLGSRDLSVRLGRLIRNEGQ